MSQKKLCDSIMRELLHPESNNTSAFLSQLKADPKLMEALALLETGGYITVKRAWGGELISVRPELRGKAYFAARAERRREKWLDRLCGFLSGVAVTVIADLIVRWLAG